AEAGTSANADERQIAYERRLRTQIESIVSKVVGPDRARVQLTADFDFNRITQTSDRFDPEGRVVRSTQTREESSGTADNQGQVTVNNELPNAPAAGTSTAARDQSKKAEEIVHYAISRTTETKVIEGGRVNRISVAVLVDGNYTKNERGEPVYQERPREELDRIAALVRTAIGFDQKRGDQVEVINLRFAEVPVTAIGEPTGIMAMLQFTKDAIMHVVRLRLGMGVLRVVGRPLVRRIITPDAPMAAGGAVADPVLPAPADVPALTDDKPIQAKPSATSKMIDIAQVQGQVHAQSVQKGGDLADRNPNETVAIVRQWRHEPVT